MKNTTVIATNRFGLGARPGDFAVADANPQAWLLDQLQGPSRTPRDFRKLPHSSKVLVDVQDLRREERQRKKSAADGEPQMEAVQKYGKVARGHFMDQVSARYKTAAGTDYPFYERLVHFWSNHFAISVDKQPLPTITGLFENEAIRPNVAGKFVDMLLAVEQHPAMIFYLDNQRSIGPGSQLAKRANKRNKQRNVGLNENLAREILELHTLGVDGGYTQEDVTTFAKVITGWSIGGDNGAGRYAEGVPGMFAFREAIHEPGKKTILGKRYAQSGVAQGEAVLRDLAAHPSTARFLATKLARHFVADEPPAGLVDKLAATYLEYRLPHHVQRLHDEPCVLGHMIECPKRGDNEFVRRLELGMNYLPRLVRLDENLVDGTQVTTGFKVCRSELVNESSRRLISHKMTREFCRQESRRRWMCG